MFKTILLKQFTAIKLFRNLSVMSSNTKESTNRVQSWQVHSYQEDVQCTSTRLPIIKTPTGVLIKVEAASVNPIDVYMKDGYGRTLVKLFKWKENDIELPVTLGRDFAGEIIDKGSNVDNFQIGDKVYGVIPFYNQGSHAEYTVADKAHILLKPSSLTHIDAASIPYTALTAYSALWITGGLCVKNPKGMRILVLGASGGVGTSAVQMLRAVGAIVIGTCSTDAVPLVQNLGADCVLDYRDPDYIKNVASQGSYDIILDCAKMGHENIPSSWKYTSYISLNSPLLKNMDQYGLIGGLTYSAVNIISSNIRSLCNGKLIQWAYFYPSTDGLKFMDSLIRNNQLSPMVHKVFKFDDMLQAYEAVQNGHLRGKVVINMLNED